MSRSPGIVWNGGNPIPARLLWPPRYSPIYPHEWRNYHEEVSEETPIFWGMVRATEIRPRGSILLDTDPDLVRPTKENRP